MSAPSEAVRPVGGGMSMSLKNAKLVADIGDQGTPVLRVYPGMATGAWSDQDWGSAGPACIFAIGVCIAAGKDGIAYLIKTAHLGGTTLADLANPKANCAKLAAPPVWLTMSPGPVDPFPIASVEARGNPPGWMPGGFCSGSSNGADANSAILVCAVPYGDANARVVNGRLLVYDLVHLAADGSLQVLWDSQQWNIPFLFNKFNPPVIDGGQMYVHIGRPRIPFHRDSP